MDTLQVLFLFTHVLLPFSSALILFLVVAAGRPGGARALRDIDNGDGARQHVVGDAVKARAESNRVGDGASEARRAGKRGAGAANRLHQRTPRRQKGQFDHERHRSR